MADLPRLVTIDIGNSRIKMGLFDSTAEATPDGLPNPTETLTLVPNSDEESFGFSAVGAWLLDHVPSGTPLVVGSVSRRHVNQLHPFLELQSEKRDYRITDLKQGDFPIANCTKEPHLVGIDRLAAAIAANAIRRPETPAIVVDFGTAVTVDLVDHAGDYQGGAILPGVTMGARALHQGTDLLPEIRVHLDGDAPPAVGKTTESCIVAGVYWGMVGAVRELVARLSDGLTAPPQVLVSGGVQPEFARLLGGPDCAVRYVPHLVLAGLALTATKVLRGEGPS